MAHNAESEISGYDLIAICHEEVTKRLRSLIPTTKTTSSDAGSDKKHTLHLSVFIEMPGRIGIAVEPHTPSFGIAPYRARMMRDQAEMLIEGVLENPLLRGKYHAGNQFNYSLDLVFEWHSNGNFCVGINDAEGSLHREAAVWQRPEDSPYLIEKRERDERYEAQRKAKKAKENNKALKKQAVVPEVASFSGKRKRGDAVSVSDPDFDSD